MTVIVWIHADCLRRECAAFQQYPTAPAVFVWDDVVLRGYGLSLKRMVFLYECLLDLDVAIYRGDVAAQVRAFAVLHDAHRVVTMATVAPTLRDHRGRSAHDAHGRSARRRTICRRAGRPRHRPLFTLLVPCPW